MRKADEIASEPSRLAQVGFGGGCHWCTEGVFQTLRGVTQVEQGYLQSLAPADTWAEGVIVTFEPSAISLQTLCEVHLRTHSTTRARSPQSKYRSAIYLLEANHRSVAEQTISDFAKENDQKVQTLVIPFVTFKASDESFQNYYSKDPNRPFCRRFIDPKLDYIRKHFSNVAVSGHGATSRESS
jgi:peptide-methionine (S)-S-oxide reductase